MGGAESQMAREGGGGGPLLSWMVNGYHRANVEFDGLISGKYWYTVLVGI